MSFDIVGRQNLLCEFPVEPRVVGNLVPVTQFSLGFVLVLCFGIGLAITMVSAGVVAALSIRHVERHWSGFSRFAHRAPYVSAALIVLVGLYTGWIGVHEIIS